MTAKVGAVVLAAGQARRFGGDKLLAIWRGQPLVVWAIRTALGASEGPVIVVVDDPAGAVAALTADWREPRLTVVEAADHALGLAHSLRAGLAALPETVDGALIFLGDMPRIPPAMGPVLIRALTDGKLAVAPMFKGRRGHPVLVVRGLFPDIDRLEGDSGAGKLLGALGSAVALVESDDDGILFDVDTPADLAALSDSKRPG